MLHVNNFSKSYGQVNVLMIEDWHLERGLYWIEGQNGSGKTTLFKSLAGIIPSSGKIAIGDFEIKENPIDYRRKVNYSEAEPLYPAFITAYDLIKFIGRAKGSNDQQQSSLMNTMGVDQYLNQSCGTFSSGMLKKLSLTLAFLGDPHMIILDEPFITLDVAARKNLIQLINDSLSQGRIILISSHQSFEGEGLTVEDVFMIQNKTLVVK